MKMKKALMVLGGTYLVLTIIIVTAVLLFRGKVNRVNKDSKEFADTVIVRIISDWDKQHLLKHASPEFIAATDPHALERDFEQFRKLGKLKEYKGSVGKSNMSINLSQTDAVVANYIATADFEAGSVKIKINIVREGDTWQIFAFDIYLIQSGDSR